MSELVFQEGPDRRGKQPDTLSRALKMLSFFSMGIIVLLSLLIVLAQPASYAVIDKRPGLGATWDPVLCPALFLVMVVGFFVGTTGLVLNVKRLKRKHDFLRVNLILLPIASLLGIVIYLVK
jgi:hypothetical protein